MSNVSYGNQDIYGLAVLLDKKKIEIKREGKGKKLLCCCHTKPGRKSIAAGSEFKSSGTNRDWNAHVSCITEQLAKGKKKNVVPITSKKTIAPAAMSAQDIELMELRAFKAGIESATSLLMSKSETKEKVAAILRSGK